VIKPPALMVESLQMDQIRNARCEPSTEDGRRKGGMKKTRDGGNKRWRTERQFKNEGQQTWTSRGT
jgi:hypothetical protein